MTGRMSSNKSLDIITVGGSLAGLMTSIALKRLGHNITIFERSPTPLLHDQGAGVVAGGETQDFMSIYDKTRRSIAVTSKQRLYLDRSGNVVHRENTAQRMTSWDLLYYLCRANFDQVDSEYLDGGKAPSPDGGEGHGTYAYGRTVTEVMGDEDGRVRVRYSTNVDGMEQKDSAHAHLVLLADGPSSKMRQLIHPNSTTRTYAGYVAFRGTVPESELSSEATAVFVEKFPFYHGQSTQILAYIIPGPAGNLTAGHRLVNWVWYVNVDGESREYQDIMTDNERNTHRFTLPTGGKMQDAVWNEQRKKARENLPPQFYELISKTRTPFVQAITDLPPPEDGRGRFLDGKAILVGDALAGFRPHTAASTSQAAFHALMLAKVFSGEIGWDVYDSEVLDFARSWQGRGIMLGNRSQFGHHPLQN